MIDVGFRWSDDRFQNAEADGQGGLSMNVTVFGAGGIGLYFAAMLARAGQRSRDSRSG
ncbi:hypothetical protein GPX89_00930 [Nocardia sp. ET3-3]|uniref:Uncharacterized protein n=1 Tax=Nocardia terrae TaxID=2675851 RepID=A0A7K1UN93_9NOCA|nr:hypothetical protein [Nocardia terrae]